MANADVARTLAVLRQEVATKAVPSSEVPSAFERLVYLLVDVPREDDQALRDLVNDLEFVRFTRLAENQVAEMGRILEAAQRLFDSLS